LAALIILALPALGSASLPLPSRAFLHPGGLFHRFAPTPTFETDAHPGPFAFRVPLGQDHDGTSGGFIFGVLSFGKERFHEKGEWSSITERTRENGPGRMNGGMGFKAALFDVTFDLHNDTIVTPWFGGGVGIVAPRPDGAAGTKSAGPNQGMPSGSDDDTLFAYRLGAGLEVTLHYGFSLDLAYRYVSPANGQFNLNSLTATELGRERHNASLGIRIRF
jgi:opacity protein-like surface antigen